MCLVRRADEKGTSSNWYASRHDFPDAERLVGRAFLGRSGGWPRGKPASKIVLYRRIRPPFCSSPKQPSEARRNVDRPIHYLFDENSYSGRSSCSSQAAYRGHRRRSPTGYRDRLMAQHARCWDKERTSSSRSTTWPRMECKPKARLCRPLENLELLDGFSCSVGGW